MNRFTRSVAGLAAVACALVFAAAAPAAPASASAASTCEFTMVSLRALNLDKDNGSRTDYVWLQVDRTWFPSGNDGVAFELFETHYASEFGNPVMGFGAGGLTIRLVLDKFPLNKTVDTDTIACTPATNRTNTFSDGDAIYEMVYSVTD
jgi:hypothetical protein